MNGLVALNPEYPTALGAIVGGLSLGLDCVCVCDGHGWDLEGGLTGVWFLGEGPAEGEHPTCCSHSGGATWDPY